MKQSPWRSSLFMKVITVFLMVIAPLYGAGIWVNQQAKSNLMEETANSMLSRVDFYLLDFEAEISRMRQLQREFIVDQDLQNLSFTSHMLDYYEWTRMVLRIQDKLQALKSVSAYIETVNVHILTINRTISSDSAITSQLAPAYKEIAALLQAAPHHMLFWRDQVVLRLDYPDLLPEGKSVRYALDVQLSTAKLSQSLSQFIDYKQSGAVIIAPAQNRTISSQPDHPIVGLLAAGETNLQQDDPKRLFFETIDDTKYLVAYKYSQSLDLYLAIYMPEREVMGKLDAYAYFLWVLSLLSVLIIVIFSTRIYRIIHKPVRSLIMAFSRIEQGRMQPVEVPSNQDEFRLLYERFNQMVDNLNVLIHEVYEQTIRAQSSELKQLQSQMNPHFLYNTYFTLYRLAQIDDRETVLQFSRYLGDYFQYMTRNATEYVPLKDELAHTKTYIQIQNIRFSNRIEVELEPLPEEAMELVVPKLIIQPIVENAFKYALEQKEEDGIIRISFAVDAQYIRIYVEDNGDELNELNLQELRQYLLLSGDEAERTGIRNVHRRLTIMFGADSGLQLSRSSLGGLCVQLNLKRLGPERKE